MNFFITIIKLCLFWLPSTWWQCHFFSQVHLLVVRKGQVFSFLAGWWLAERWPHVRFHYSSRDRVTDAERTKNLLYWQSVIVLSCHIHYFCSLQFYAQLWLSHLKNTISFCCQFPCYLLEFHALFMFMQNVYYINIHVHYVLNMTRLIYYFLIQ